MIPIVPIVALSIISSTVLYVNYSYDKMVYGSLKNKREALKGVTATGKKTIKKSDKEEVKEEPALEKVEGEIVSEDKEEIIREYENSAPIKKKDIGPNSPFTIISEEETHAPKFDTLKEEGKKISELDNLVELNSIVEEKLAEEPVVEKTDTEVESSEEGKTESTTEKKTTTKKSEKEVEEKPAKKPAAKKKTTIKKPEKVDKKESEDK
jgi:hypothetical protein